MGTKYKPELEAIIQARRAVYMPSPLILAIIVVGLVAEQYVSGAGSFFGLAAFFIFYKRIKKVAYMPCPRCGKPFGTSSNIPLGVGSNYCESCALSLYDENV